jgi:hypothetical protein
VKDLQRVRGEHAALLERFNRETASGCVLGKSSLIVL